MHRLWIGSANDAQPDFSCLNNDLGNGFDLRQNGWRYIGGRLDYLDRQQRCCVTYRAEHPVLILLAPSKYQIGIDVMLTSNDRYG